MSHEDLLTTIQPSIMHEIEFALAYSLKHLQNYISMKKKIHFFIIFYLRDFVSFRVFLNGNLYLWYFIIKNNTFIIIFLLNTLYLNIFY